MTAVPLAACLAAAGFALLARFDNRPAQWAGAGVVAAALLAAAAPAFADETLTVTDNARVECTASKSDLTRVSLIGDAFVSVAKLQPENPLDDFSIVNEPTRGDIYVSVPSTFRPGTLSFFATSRKGFVYKFACRIAAVEAQQIFLSNPDAVADRATADPAAGDEQAPDRDEAALRLIQAMASGKVVTGYRLTRSALAPVRTGALTVQLLAEYRGAELTGRVVRIENTGTQAAELSEERVAPPGAVAVALGRTRLASRQATSAYVVLREGSN